MLKYSLRHNNIQAHHIASTSHPSTSHCKHITHESYVVAIITSITSHCKHISLQSFQSHLPFSEVILRPYWILYIIQFNWLMYKGQLHISYCRFKIARFIGHLVYIKTYVYNRYPRFNHEKITIQIQILYWHQTGKYTEENLYLTKESSLFKVVSQRLYND